jgi:hypothetical protein
MKRKHLRTIVITALVLALAVTLALRLKIEPATGGAPAISAPPTDSSSGVDTIPDNKAQPDTDASGDKDEGKTEASDPLQPPADEQTEPVTYTCTLEIRCDTVTDTSVLENQAVAPYVPADGVILAETEIVFSEGENVFDVLLRATRERDIHMEFRDDNMYSGKYIEGINYLYEMDGGPLSGWMYKVNGKFPNYGCAAYKLEDKDAIVWVYTCDLGMDVGDNSVWQ